MLGFGSVEYTSAKETVQLELKNPGKHDEPSKESVSLRDLVQSVVPPVRLNPLMSSGHVQTIYVASGRGEQSHIHYKRRLWKSDNPTYPGQFATDFVIPEPKELLERDKSLPPRTHNFAENEWTDYIDTDDTSPLLIVMHGLSGGSHEQYVRHCLKDLTSKEGGWSAVVINARGCCYTKLTSNVLFNARATWDVRQFVKWARATWPNRRMFGIGFSLGANILCNYVGEEGDACELEAAILVGNPWNLDVSNAVLCNSFIGLHVYQQALAQGLKKLSTRHMDQMSQNPKINPALVQSARYLYEWDRYVQCPSWGYPTEAAYYRDASSADAALNIKIPVLALHAKDDPVCADIAVPYSGFEATPYIVMCASSIGGHLGWIETSGERWSNKVIHGFLKKFVDETLGMKIRPEGSSESTKSTVIDVNKPTYDPLRRKLFFRD